MSSGSSLQSWYAEFNDTATRYPAGSIPEVFDSVAAIHSCHPAVVHGDQLLTYAELSGLSVRIASGLRAAGVGTGDRVLVHTNRSLHTVALLLGILRAGAGYVGVDPTAPRQRRAVVAAEASANLDVVDAEAGTDVGRHVTTVDELLARPARGTWTPTRVAADALAYVAFTSGSTGTPKGVCVTHRGVVRLSRGQRWARLDPTTRMMHVAPW